MAMQLQRNLGYVSTWQLSSVDLPSLLSSFSVTVNYTKDTLTLLWNRQLNTGFMCEVLLKMNKA